MSDNNGKNNDNVFDFSAMKKALEELRKEQERQQKERQAKKQKSEADDFLKMMQAFGELFKPPSKEEMDKAVTQFADSLEKAAKALREMQQPTTEDEKGEEDDS